MTCIAALVDNGRGFMGADSAGVGGYSLTIRADAKLFERDGYVIGFTSSFRMGQLIRYRIQLPQLPGAGADLERFMVVEFVEAIRAGLKEGGCARKKDDVETGGTFLVGLRGSLFCIHDDFQVCRARTGYDACGCGYDLALGSLHTTRKLRGLEPKQRVLLALEAAAHHSTGVAPPFYVLSAGGAA